VYHWYQINYTGGKFAQVLPDVSNTGGKLAACVKYTSSKFATGINNTGGKFCQPLESLIPVANLPPVSTTLVAICHWYQRHQQQICHRCQ
jgi:hypothetical protein